MCTPCMGEAATKRFLMPLTFSTGRSGAEEIPASVFISRSGQTGYCMLFSYAWIIFLTIWPPTEPASRLVRSPL